MKYAVKWAIIVNLGGTAEVNFSDFCPLIRGKSLLFLGKER